MFTVQQRAVLSPGPSTLLRFGSDGCPVCLGAMALKATHQQMQRIRNQQVAPAPAVMPAYLKMQSSVAGSRAAVVPEDEEPNVLLSTFTRLFDKVKQQFDLTPHEGLLKTVMHGVDTARRSHGKFDKTLTGSNHDPVPFFPHQLPDSLDHPHTYNVVHYQNHLTDATNPSSKASHSLMSPYALGNMTLQHVDASQPELMQLNAREYPTGQQWMAAGTGTALSMVMAARDNRFKRLAVVTEPYRTDLANPYQPDVLAFVEQLCQRQMPVTEYDLPQAGKLGKHTLPKTPLPPAYKQVLKATYPQTWQQLRVFQLPLDAVKTEYDRLQSLVNAKKLDPLYVDDKLLGYVWTGDQAGVF